VPDVENLPEINAKKPGGITGKGFMPGQSGNPLGRPKGKTLTSIIREAVEEIEGAKTLGRILVETAISEARSGNFQFFKEIMERVDGKVTDKLAVTGIDFSKLTTDELHAIVEDKGGGGIGTPPEG